MGGLVIDLSDYKPLEWQKELHNSDATFKCAIGGFGSGKTRWLIEECLYLLLKYPHNYGVIMRKTYPELDDTTKKMFLDRVPKQLIRDERHTRREYEFINGSVVVFRAFNDMDKIKNLDIGFFAIDQAEELPESYFWILASRFKLPYKNIKYEGILAANPAGKNWIWRLFFVDKKDDPDYCAIVSTTEDNKENLPEGYIERLKEMFPEKWVQRYMYSSFDEFSGNVFYAYSDKYRMNLADMEFNKYPEYKVIVTIDPGLNNPTAVLFSALEEETGNLYIFDEIYETDQIPRNIVFLINKKLEKWNIEYVWKFLIDPASKQRGIASGKSVFQEYRKEGLNVLEADNSFHLGVIRVNQYFSKGKIRIHTGIKHLIEEIEGYIWDEPKKVLEDGFNSPERPISRKDHLCDCLRYTIMGIPERYILDDFDPQRDKKLIANFYNRLKLRNKITGY